MTAVPAIENPASSSIGLDEVVDYLDHHLESQSSDSLMESAPVFGGLYFNKDLIKDHVLASLDGDFSSFQVDNPYAPSSLVLHRTRQYMIRAVLWQADRPSSGIDIYGLIHDHNFDFLTLGYSGPGYQSKMYAYDYEKVEGRIGEQVKLQDLGMLNLGEGEMFLYRKNYHVHQQLPPPANSVTINLMTIPPSQDASIQYLFDARQSIIAGANGGFYAQKPIFDMARLLDDEECNDVMRYISENSECHLTREYLSDYQSKID